MQKSVFSNVFVLACALALAQSTPQHPLPPRPAENLSSSVTIVLANEPGEQLVIEGQVFAPDGDTPVPGIDVHPYNTDAQGHYAASGSFYPPRLQGWAKTVSLVIPKEVRNPYFTRGPWYGRDSSLRSE
jgi:hypothetical protein